MRHIITSLAAFLVAGLALAAPAQAQNLCTFNGTDGVKVTCSAANPLPVTAGGAPLQQGGTIGNTAFAVTHVSYTLLNAATSTGSQSLAPDTYGLSFPTAFNGATLTVTFTDAGGSTSVLTYTSAPASAAVFTVFNGTSVTATAAGGTPTGTLKINGGPPSMWATLPLPVIASGTSYADVSVASLSAGQAAGTTAVLAADPTRQMLAITPSADGRIYIATSASAGFYIPIYAGVTRILSGPDCPTNAIFVTGQTVSTALLMAKG